MFMIFWIGTPATAEQCASLDSGFEVHAVGPQVLGESPIRRRSLRPFGGPFRTRTVLSSDSVRGLTETQTQIRIRSFPGPSTFLAEHLMTICKSEFRCFRAWN